MLDTLIVKPIFNALMLLYSVIPGGDFGVAIILFTILVRFLLYPLVKSQLHQTKMMRKLQPELAKIKERSNGDKQAEATAMMDLYKRYGVNPFRSILVLLIQLPIFIGLYQVIQIITLHRDQVAKYTYDSIEHITAIQRIIVNPNDFNHTMLGFIDLTKTAFSNGVNMTLVGLALVAAITQFIMTKQTMPSSDKPNKKFGDLMKEAADGKQADASEVSTVMMDNMLKIMPVVMFFIMVTLPGALALYYTASNIVAVIQQHYLLNKDTDELEEIASESSVSQPRQAKGAQKKATARSKSAKEAHVTRIVAKDSRKKKG